MSFSSPFIWNTACLPHSGSNWKLWAAFGTHVSCGVKPAQFAVSTYCTPLQVCCCVFRCLPWPAPAGFLAHTLSEYADYRRMAEYSKRQVLFESTEGENLDMLCRSCCCVVLRLNAQIYANLRVQWFAEPSACLLLCFACVCVRL